jgi:hypothetical protein
MTIERSDTYWDREGFVEMVGPMRPPTSDDGEMHIVVYVRLPIDPALAVHIVGTGPDGMPLLEYPPGTVSDRVEYFGTPGVDDPIGPTWVVLDVRGTRVTTTSQEFHVFRPRTDRPGGALLGLSWPRGDDLAQARATDAVGALVETGRVLGPPGSAARAAAASSLRALNDCASCHAAKSAPETRAASTRVHRGTDASGFFQVSSVLRDESPLEVYRPRNANAGDSLVRFVCKDGGDAQVEANARANVHCPGGSVPVGILDLPAAMKAGDPHARRLCASRRYLYAHLDAAARDAFASAERECEAP